MQHRCYTSRMPTTRKRHTITETPPVERALEALREEAGHRVDLAELVIIGAEAKLAAMQAAKEETAEGRRRIAERVRRGETLVDPQAARAVRKGGWVRP